MSMVYSSMYIRYLSILGISVFNVTVHLSSGKITPTILQYEERSKKYVLMVQSSMQYCYSGLLYHGHCFILHPFIDVN